MPSWSNKKSGLAWMVMLGLVCLSGCAPVDEGTQGVDGGVDDLTAKAASTTQYEAEDRTATSGCVESTARRGYTGRGFMDFGGSGTWIEWNNISAQASGESNLTFRYANGTSTNLRAAIFVNGTNLGNVAFAGTGGWARWNTATLKVTLRQGTNVVRVRANTVNGGPNLDNVVVAAVDACPSDPNKTEPGACGCGVPEGSCGGTSTCATADEWESVTLSCTGGNTINRITFASYGTPDGSCAGGFSNGSCHAASSLEEVQAACLGKQSCTVEASNDVFGDPCGGVGKRLAVTYACGTTTTPPPQGTPVFLMAGQSNMVGNVDPGLFDQLISELGSGTSSTLQSRLKGRLYDWYFNSDGGYPSYGYSDAMATFESSELIRLKNAGLVGGFLKTPLSNVMCTMNSNQVSGLTTNCGSIFGPELLLGHYLKAKGYAPTSLIKVAQGGTNLYTDWRSPKTVAQSGGSVGPLYTQLQSRIDSLKSSPASVHPTCTTQSCRWGGFIWFQGENDTMDQAAANAYAKNLTNLIADVRGRVGSSNLPVVIVEIGKWAQTMDYGATVLSAQRSVVAADANTRIVKTDDLSGFYHYDPAGQLIIGERVGIALSSMLGTVVDGCPNDPNKTEPGACGCGVPEGTCGGQGGLKGSYFNNEDFTGQAVVRTDASVNFDWGRGSPDPSMDGDTFSVRWVGFVKPQYTQTYTFYTVSDDAVRLWIDGTLVIDNWTEHSATEDSGTISLQAGKSYSVKMEYFEGGGDAVAKLLWSSASQAKQVIPQAQLSSEPSGGVDNCPNDPNKTEPGQCGCGVPEGTCSGSTAKCVIAPTEGATASLSCSSGQVIKTISFASYGQPTGTCPNVAKGTCHASSSLSKVQALCLNRASCSVDASNEVFDDDPCSGVNKKLAVTYVCGSTDTAPVENAMTALTNHLKGTAALNASQIAAQKAIVDANTHAIGATSKTIGIAFDLVTTYENVHGPLFMNAANADMTGADWNPGFDRKALKNDIHMAILNVMQGIVDHAYAGQNVSTFESVINGRKFKSSEYFPGKVTSTPNPSVVHTATIKGDYPRAWGHPVMNDNVPFARKPTGTYLAPGSIATVTVPQALVGRGFQIRVGAHAEDYSKSNDFIRRMDRVSIVYPISGTVTKVGNPLGGGIYIDVPYLANAGTVTVQIQNAVRAPFYSMTSLRRTTLAEWQNTERNFGAPWADFQTDKFMAQIPTSWISKYNDPSVFLTFWDNAMDAVSDLMGFPRVRNKEVLYMVADRSWRYGVGAPGYPSSNMLYLPQEEPFSGNEQNALTMGPAAIYDEGFQTELHELGHGQLFAKLLDWEYESAVEVLAAAVINRKYGKSLDEAHRLAVSALPVPKDKASFVTLPNTAIEWMTCENFKLGKYMSEEEGQYQLKGSAKYIQIADILGWQVLDSFWRSTNLDHEAGVKVDMSVNGLILRMSKAAGVDVTPLLHFWGNMPSDVASMKAAIAAANLPRSAKIYDRLIQYQNSVPANNQAFRTFAQNWWGKQPAGDGVTEAYHAQLWNSYDATYASQLRANIQKIITLYFPDGRP